QAKTKKASKRKQPEAPKSTKGKREKSTSSIAAASSPETEDPLLPAIQAFQNAKNVKKGCIVKALRNCGMNTRHTERNKLRNYIHAIKACLHYKEIHGTISDKALRDICLKWSVSQSRIAKLLLVAEPKKEVYFKYQKDNLPKIAERKKSTSAKSVGASIEEEDPLVAAMIAFQNDRGINSIAKILSDNGLTSSSTRCELVRRYIYAIGECFLHESDGTISDETLKKNLR
ncbi:MAG TPA: hypothetical protein VLG76_07115, partial [Rhabdochlamydiaceae bacterium]|nr:hypothetical protein [Rhabdochlamydiaceae bacterium]